MKKTIKKILWILFLFAVVFIIVSQETMKARLDVKIAKQTIIYEETVEYNKKLTNIFESLDTDEYVYNQARKRLNMIKENETIIIDSKANQP